MNYGNILTTTWKTIWKEKAILWFGMLMVIAPIILSILIGSVIATGNPDAMQQLLDSAFAGVGLVIFFFAYFIFIAFSVLLSGLSFTGTLKGTLLAQSNQETITFRALWEASMPYLWRMLGVMFTVGAALALLYSVPLLFMALIGILTAGIGFLCAVPFLLLLIPVGLVGYLLLSLSMAALIAEDEGVFEAIKSAWLLLKTKFWQLVLMTVILYMIQVGIGMIIAVPMNIIQFAFIIPIDSGSIPPETIFRYVGIFMALFIPLSAILQSFSLTYVNGAWMLSYLEASTPAVPTHETENEIVEYDA